MSLELDIRRIHSDRIIDNKNCEICEIDLLCVGDKSGLVMIFIME